MLRLWLETRTDGRVQARIGLAPCHAKVHTINAIRMRLAWRSSLLEPSRQTSSTPSFSSGLTTLANLLSREVQGERGVRGIYQ